MFIPVDDVIETPCWSVQEPLDRVPTVIEYENDWLQAQVHHRRQLLDSQLPVEVNSVGRSISCVGVLTSYRHQQTGTFYPFGTVSLPEPRRGRHQRNTQCFPTRFGSCRQSQVS